MTFCGEEEWRSGMRKAQPKGGLTKGFYSLEKYRHSLEKSGYADFFCSWGSSTAPMKFQ